MERFTIRLQTDEKDAIWRLAQEERRDPRDQAALIIRQELERRGLLLPGQDAEAVGVNDDHAQ